MDAAFAGGEHLDDAAYDAGPGGRCLLAERSCVWVIALDGGLFDPCVEVEPACLEPDGGGGGISSGFALGGHLL